MSEIIGRIQLPSGIPSNPNNPEVTNELKGSIKNPFNEDIRRAKTVILGPSDIVPIFRLIQLEDVQPTTEFGEGSLLVYNATTEDFELTSVIENPNLKIICGKY